MAADFDPTSPNAAPGMLAADDPRIPAAIGQRFGQYEVTVSKVVPVIGVDRQEWWLFDAEDNLLDVISLAS